tara:strand:+ start:57630 stop:57812 length:183 start_codon:yes stop_codon:yes gene_type:complete
MKIRRNSSMFESSRRRRRLPVIRIALLLGVVALFTLAWQRGGERPQAPVEKPIAPEKLGQ